MCAVWGFYAAYIGSSILTLRDNLSGPVFSGDNVLLVLKMGICCPETSVGHYHSVMRKIPKRSTSTEDGNDMLSRNVGGALPLYGA